MQADAIISAPFGAITITCQDDFLTGLAYVPQPLAEKIPANRFVEYIASQIQSYLQDSRTVLQLPYVLHGTPFQKRVWQAIAQIPLGEVQSYGVLAEQLGSGPRAVANACGANPVPLLIPCHRVVAKNGLGGFMQGEAQGAAIKTWLLQHERANFVA